MMSAASGELVMRSASDRQNGLRRKVIPAVTEGQWPPAHHRHLYGEAHRSAAVGMPLNVLCKARRRCPDFSWERDLCNGNSRLRYRWNEDSRGSFRSRSIVAHPIRVRRDAKPPRLSRVVVRGFARASGLADASA